VDYQIIIILDKELQCISDADTINCPIGFRQIDRKWNKTS